MNTIAALAKPKLRSQAKKMLKKITPNLLCEKSMLIHNSLVSLDCYNTAELIITYVSIAREVDTAPLIKTALNHGKKVYIPRIRGPELRFHRITGTGMSLKPNRYGIPEPDKKLPALTENDMNAYANVIIVPGLAFDRQKNRLGRGKGYYDRFLNKTKKNAAAMTTLMGICFSEQLYPVLPTDDNDIPMDIVITDRELVS